MYKVSFAVCVYQSDYDKLMLTLKSIIAQKNIVAQIVISDDGSEFDNFDRITFFFENHNFYNYKLTKLCTNKGTVQNLKNAINECDYDIIRPLSAGDFIIGETLIAEWIEYMISKKYDWSFGNVVCYHADQKGNIVTSAHYCHPQDVDVYIHNNTEKARWNYVVCEDIVFGSAVIYKKSLFKIYLDKIVNRVKYAEDNVFRLMMFDGIIPAYFDKSVVMYEYGEGVSTSNNAFWREKIKRDWDVTTNIMLKEETYSGYKNVIAKGLQEKELFGVDCKLQISIYDKRMTPITLGTSVLMDYDYERCCISKLHYIQANSKDKNIFIYGAGKAGMIAYEQLNTSLNIKGFVDRNAENIKVVNDLPVIKIDGIDPDRDYLIVCLFEYTNDFVDYLKQYQFDESNCCFIPACKEYNRCIIEGIENI